MSWHTTGVLIHGPVPNDSIELLESLGLEPGDLIGDCTFDEATSSRNEGVAIGRSGEWTAMFSNMAFLMVDKKSLARASKNGRLFQLILEGASDTAGFSWWVAGKNVRSWLKQEGEVLMKSGSPLPEEKTAHADGDDEQAMLALMEAMTLPISQLEAITYRQFEVNLDDLLEAMS